MDRRSGEAPLQCPAMNIAEAEQLLHSLWGEIHDLRSACDLVEWDQDTTMPRGGAAARGKVAATLEGLKHRSLTSPELREALDVCAQAPTGSLLAAQGRCARYEVDRATKVPLTLAKTLAEARVVGLEAWRRAREASDFSLFEGDLNRMIELKRQEAAAIDPNGSPYDVILDEFEPGATEAELAPLFDGLREALTRLVSSVAESAIVVDEAAVHGDFLPARQQDFGRLATTALGFDFAAGRLDEATHPSCVGIDRRDVRLTWRYEVGDFRPAIFGILHEAGHGLYEQGLPADLWRTPAGTVMSLCLHESQSRLWENHVGRSRGFWRWALPHYREMFPDAPKVDVDTIWSCLHTVKPSLIRVEADQGTYNLHVAVRFELERALFSGRLEARDLPAAWDDLYQEYLGVRSPDAARGVLQDIHWSQGMFGYFPTYTLGTMAAAQLFAAASRDLGDLEAAFSEGNFQPLLRWLREKIHRHGSRYDAGELIERVTGKPLTHDDLLAHLSRTTDEVYGQVAAG